MSKRKIKGNRDKTADSGMDVETVAIVGGALLSAFSILKTRESQVNEGENQW
jgi:hypothetical protein